MTANYHTPLSVCTPLDTVQLNKRFGELDGALNGLSEGLFNFADLAESPSLPSTGYYKPAIVNGVLVFLDSTGLITLNTPADYALVRDKKTSGSDGGTFTASAWQTRTLNEIVVDTGNRLSLASNQITAEAGTYIIYAIVPAFEIGNHQARLQNITDGTTELWGTCESSPTSGVIDYPTTYSYIVGRITITDTKVFEVQHYCTSTNAGDGFGRSHGWGDEIYTSIVLRRQS